MFGKEKEPTRGEIEQSVLEKVALQSVAEQRRKRRWGIFFKLAFLAYLIFLGVIWYGPFSGSGAEKQAHIAQVDIDGIIAEDTRANARLINKSLDQAFKAEHAKAVVIHINSPGGSPVQADTIYQHIRYLEKQHPKLPVYALCTDACASGGYYIAAAADKIYANKMTLVGSIGVRASGFGFVEAIKKIGITRRMYTAGQDKAFLDPFLPEQNSEVKELNRILEQTHQVFINAVKNGRGKRLAREKTDTIFSGQPFSGIEGKRLGLIDDYATMPRLKRQLKVDKVINYTRKEDLLERITDKIGVSMATQVLELGNLQLR